MVAMAQVLTMPVLADQLIAIIKLDTQLVLVKKTQPDLILLHLIMPAHHKILKTVDAYFQLGQLGIHV